ncbi:hypothetical protein BDW71DRAFT_198029 [Aspergillus fruticulosus]
MAPFLNFLGKKSAGLNGGEADTQPDARPSEDSHRSTPLSIRKSYETGPPEYKLSVVDCNGDYLPPSPPEKESFWRKYPGKRSSSNHRNLVDENEPFSISRESFDSYRRSFDISARSPIIYPDNMPSRTSLDSRFSRITSTSEYSGQRPAPTMEEDQFEEVGLNDDNTESKPKKKGIFSRFGDLSSDAQAGGSKPSSHLGFHIPGRKKSAQAPPSSEMRAIISPYTPEVAEELRFVMVGVKRRVDTGDDRNGKRTKTKTAVSIKGKSAPVKAQKGRKSSTNGKDVKGSKKDKKASKKKDSEIEDVEDDVDMDDVDADEDEEEKEAVKDKRMVKSKAQEDEETKSTFYLITSVRNPTNMKRIETSSRESHIKQKALLQERKAAKPNADQIARSKKLWERLRRKSHVPLEERKKLIAELFDIITGRVKDFVFKHDSVRVIQTALKYANVEQRKQIAHELKGSYVELAQSKYAKFLIGKLIVHGDSEIRDLIIAEFYGKVKRLIRHPEGSWILDDIYRTVATQEQRANMLREWYGAEFAIFRDNNTKDKEPTADLSEILEEDPAKRSPIMHFLLELINQLIQKKTTGFTMLHDAMLQYFLNVKPGTSDATEFIELIKGDEEGDLVKNLAFTKSGVRLMCLALAYSTAKDRKHLTRFYKDTIKMMAGDLHGHLVLLAAYEVIDDTKLTAKLIFPELLNQNIADDEARNEELLYQSTDLTARIPILYPFASDPNNTNTKRLKWLLPEQDFAILDEIRSIRKETSKKDPVVRRTELIKAASPTLLDLITARADSLLATSFGCQFLLEVLFDADDSDGKKPAALSAVATAAKSCSDTKDSPFVGRMLKSLVQGGRFNVAEKRVEKVSPPLGFDALLYEQIRDEIMAWATGSNVYVVVALVESEEFEKRNELIKALKKGKKDLEAAAKGGKGPAASGAKLLLEKIA